MKGVRHVRVEDPAYPPFDIYIVVPHGGDPWGTLAPLRGTVWGDLIREVSGEALSHALHGWATPLAKEIGPEPRVLSRKVPDQEGVCAMKDTCPSVGPGCRPGSRLPDCYEAPNLGEGAGKELASWLALVWREGSYVLVVVGEEFSFR